MAILSWTENVEEEYDGYNMSLLYRDRFYLTTVSDLPDYVYLYSKFKECNGCPYRYRARIYPQEESTLTESSSYPMLYRILSEELETSPVDDNSSVLCNLDENFGEFGIYRLQVNSCTVETIKEPVDIYFPILTVVLIFSLISAIVYTLIFLYDKFYKNKSSKDEADASSKKERVLSLDTFRGISIVMMVFVNYGAGGYSLFGHATWNGLHLADVVFPSFLWIMGLCIPISVASMFKRGQSIGTSLKQIVKRSCILFAIGLFLGSGPFLSILRILGVLQRFGICYCVVASMCVVFYGNGYTKAEAKQQFKDLKILCKEWGVAGVILVCHCLVTFLVADEGCPKGYLGPGGDHDDGKYFNCTGGATGYIDKLILGNHIYQHPTIQEIYKSSAFDPEGILGCLTSIVQVVFGVQAGVILLVFKGKYERLIRWVIWGILSGVAGAALCGASKDDGLIPVNKNLWSISFVLVTTSMAFLVLSLCYYIIDIKKWWSGKPFSFAGMNSILIYVGHSMVSSNFPIHWAVEGQTTHFITTFENVWATNSWIMIAYYLYRIKVFFSI